MTEFERQMTREALARDSTGRRGQIADVDQQRLAERIRHVEALYEQRCVLRAISAGKTAICGCCGVAGLLGACPNCSPDWCLNCGDCALHCHCGAFERACKAR